MRLMNMEHMTKPYGPLMYEHRIIEQMAALMKQEVEVIRKEGKVDPHFIDVAVGFIRTYADKCHHGKEEDILFKRLESKPLSEQHRKIINELIEEHKIARKAVAGLLDAKERYVKGDADALEEIRSLLLNLNELYMTHIEKEDKHCFIEVMQYFSEEEQRKMTEDMWEFDRKMIHTEYKDKVDEVKKEMSHHT
ncbi:MAG: hemerythrin domain-containing protein [Candidatus Woesearchaeota archaeon]